MGGLTRIGEGPPLLMLNGYAATKDDWDPAFLGALAGTHELLCPDSRGVGDSELESSAGGIGELAADAIEVLDQAGVASAAVLGWSMGGFVAQELAAIAPERVDALVLLSTDPGAGAIRCSEQIWSNLTDRSGDPREQASRLLGLLFPPDVASRIDEQFGDVVAQARARLGPPALDSQEAAMAAWHSDQGGAARLAAITVPTLVAAGTEDIVIPPENAALLAAALENSWLARFPGGGHAFMAQEPERLARLIGLFLGERG